MTIVNSIVVLLLFLVVGCIKTTNPDKRLIQLKYEIVPEDPRRNLYYVEWTDTLGLSEGYLPGNFIERPKEIHCFVTSENNDILGYYQGLSMPQSFCYFQTTDSVVNFNFMIGLNIFSDKFDNWSVSKILSYYEANKNPIELEPLMVNIKNNTRKVLDVELIEK